MLKNLVNQAVLSDIRGRLDKCPFRHIKPYLKGNDGEVTQIVVAANGQDLAELGAFGVAPLVEGNVLQNVLFELRETGKWKQIILSGNVKPEMKKYGWSIPEIADDEAIECFLRAADLLHPVSRLQMELKIMFDEDFWGEPISVYTDADAQSDGILIDVSDLGVKFNGRMINRVTVGATLATALKEKQPATAKNNLQFIAQNSDYDGDGETAWGIFQPDARFGNEKLWLVPNEVDGYTLMLSSEY